MLTDLIQSNNNLNRLYQSYPEIENLKLDEIYKKCISIFQSNKARSGRNLEDAIEIILQEEKIPFKKQVQVSENGTIIKSKQELSDNEKCYRVDFIVGSNIQFGQNISNHCIISCKTSLRERGEQERKIHNFPYVYFLVTTTSEKVKDKNIVLISTKDFTYDIDFLVEFLKANDGSRSNLLKQYHNSKSNQMNDTVRFLTKKCNTQVTKQEIDEILSLI